MSMISRRMQMATAGQVSGVEFVYTRTNDALNTSVNAYNDAVAGGWNGNDPLRYILDGCDILGNSPSSPAFDLRGTYPNGITLQINDNTRIMGRGGSSLTSTGGNGGPAIQINTDVTIELDSSNISTGRQRVIVFGGGGGGGTGKIQDADTSGKGGTSYQNFYVFGGGGSGGGSNFQYSSSSLPSAIGTSGTTGGTLQSGSTQNSYNYWQYTQPFGSTTMPSGYGAAAIFNASPELTAASVAIYGNSAGTTIPYFSGNTVTGFSRTYNTLGSSYGWFDIGNAYAYNNSSTSTVSGGSTGSKTIVASGCGGGYGSNGGGAAAYNDFTSYPTYAYGGGSGGEAIKKTSGTEVITFTGDLTVGTSYTSRIHFQGSYT